MKNIKLNEPAELGRSAGNAPLAMALDFLASQRALPAVVEWETPAGDGAMRQQQVLEQAELLHDVNNVFTVLQIQVEFLETEPGLNGAAGQVLGGTRETVQRLGGLLRKIQDLNRAMRNN